MPGSFRETLKWLDPFFYVDEFLMPRIKALGAPLQWAVFAFSYLCLLAAVFFLFAGSAFVGVLLTALYAYLFFFGRVRAVEWSVYILSSFVFAFILYNFVLSFLLGTNAPLVIVFSGSMEQVLYRGDIVVLGNASNMGIAEAIVDFPVRNRLLLDFAKPGYAVLGSGISRVEGIKIRESEYRFDRTGPIVVYHSGSQAKDIIHRAVLKLRASDGDFLITQGDNALTNPRPDQDCTQAEVAANRCISPFLVPVESLRGRYIFHVPLVGYVKLLIFDDLPRLFSGQSV